MGEFDGLSYLECVGVLSALVKHNLIKRDPADSNSILVYRNSGSETPEGWYSQNIMSVASELADDLEGQRYLLGAVLENGIHFERLTDKTVGGRE